LTFIAMPDFRAIRVPKVRHGGRSFGQGTLDAGACTKEVSVMINLATQGRGGPDYGFGTRLPGVTLEEARAKVTDAIASEGFGVLTEIDMRATLKKKLGVDIRPYLILGACNPVLAHRALDIEPYVGLFLPCNITLWQDEGDVVVTIASPEALIGVVADERLQPIADEAEHRLRCALERIVA